MPKIPRIQSLILSQFHIKKGFTIIELIQPEEQLITPTQFAIYSQLILFRQELCGRLLASEFMDRYFLVGVPLLSRNKEGKTVYERAKYLYAVSILVKKEYYLDEQLHQVYKQIVNKLTHFFKFIQQLSNIIYNNSIPQNKQYLHKLLHQTYTSINNNSETVLSHFSTCFTILNLNRSPFSRDCKEISKAHVPITYLLDSQIQEIQCQFGKKLMRFAKIGDFNIRKICQIVQDQKGVIKYYSKGMEMGVIFMVDMFYLDNRYCLTENILKYLDNRSKIHEEQLQMICQEISLKKSDQAASLKSFNYSSNSQAEHPSSSNSPKRITTNMLLFLYFQLSRKSSIKKVIEDNIEIFSRINVIKWIRISQILGIVQRVYEKFAVVDQKGKELQSHLMQVEGQYINQERLREYYNSSQKALKKVDYLTMGMSSQSNQNTGALVHSIIKEQLQRMNSLFNMHLKNMDTIDQISVSLKISKATLMNLLNFNNQKKLKIFYVTC